jgi:hypothetical protein
MNGRHNDELRARHEREPLSDAELDRLTDNELRILALDEALYGDDVVGDPLPPALVAYSRRPGAGRRWRS